MMKSFRAPMWLAVKRMILAVGVAGALHAAAVTQAEASASCTAVNSGSFNLTTPASDPGNTSILTAWTVGDRITATFADAVGFSHADGFFHGPTLGGIGALEQGTVSSGGNVQLMHTVVAGDLTNGILLDPENNEFRHGNVHNGADIDVHAVIDAACEPKLLSEQRGERRHGQLHLLGLRRRSSGRHRHSIPRPVSSPARRRRPDHSATPSWQPTAARLRH